MNLGDQPSIIIVTSCEKCVGDEAHLWSNAHYSTLEDGLVNLAAPGGTAAEPIPTAASGFQYSEAWGTSQATAFVGGVAAAMLSCYPKQYKWDGRWLKTRLQVTSDPMPRPDDALRVTGGIVNLDRALLDPEKDWIKLGLGNGFKSLNDVSWCKSALQLRDVDTNDEVATINTADVGAILRFHESATNKPQWQIARAEVGTAFVRWSGPGAWPDNEPILTGRIGEGDDQQEVVLTGSEIFSFVPNLLFKNIKVRQCPPVL